MAVYIVVEDPAALLKSFKAKIAGSGADSITTWTQTSKGFEHDSSQLKGKALASASETTYDGKKALHFWFAPIGNQEKWAEFIFPEMNGNLVATFIKHFYKKYEKIVVVDERQPAKN